MTKVKLCGLRRKEDILAANRYRPDWIGFVFAKSKRQVSKEEAAELKQLLSPKILAVGVFVDAPVTEMVSLYEAGIIDVIQLHGGEGPQVVEEIQARCSAPIIQAVSVRGKEDVEKALLSKADYLLFDSGSGGTGQSFDWAHLGEMKRPFFLAGGIRQENLEEALQLHPFAIDVSSGVETDGYKDEEKIKQLMETVRRREQ